MALSPGLTPREVAELSQVPKRVIEKAIEDRVLKVRRGPKGRGLPSARRLLPAYSVAYALIVSRLDLKLGLAQKKRLARWLSEIKPKALRKSRWRVAPAVELEPGLLIGDAMDRTQQYQKARDALILIDLEIMGGTPIIRGTRMTVYSVLGRIEHGETVDLILDENPHLSRKALEAAIIYARAHPLIGRPGGRPWMDA